MEQQAALASDSSLGLGSLLRTQDWKDSLHHCCSSRLTFRWMFLLWPSGCDEGVLVVVVAGF